MNFRLFLSSSYLLLLLLLPFAWLLLVSCSNLDLFRSCIKQYNCGNITGVEYPFRGDDRPEDCGYPHLYLYCKENQTSIDIQGVEYNVLAINTNTQTLHIARVDLLDGLCSEKLPNNTAFDSEEFEYAPDSEEITLHYDCPPVPDAVLGLFTCPSQSAFKNVFVQAAPRTQAPTGCNSTLKVGAPKNSSVNIGDFLAMEEALREGFEVKYKEEEDIIGFCSNCTTSGGACAHDWTSSFGRTTCSCPDGSSGQKKCPPLPPSISQKERGNALRPGFFRIFNFSII